MNSSVFLDINNFNLSLSPSYQSIDIKKLIKNFTLDVRLNNNETAVMQNNTIVSEYNVDLCSTNRKKKVRSPVGYVKLQYSEKKQKTTTMAGMLGTPLLTIPPNGPIPNGTWCTFCYSQGPKFHKINCQEPYRKSLNLTLYGFIKCLLKDNRNIHEYDDLKNEMVKRVKSELNNTGQENLTKSQYVDIYNSILEKHPEFLKYTDDIGTNTEWPTMSIEYDSVISSVGPKVKKNKSVFPNCVIIKYNFETTFGEQRSVSIRVYDKGNILFVSCPWEHKNFFSDFLDKLNSTQSVLDNNGNQPIGYDIDYSKTQVKSVFSIFRLDLGFDLDTLYAYLWPLDENGNPRDSNIKETYTKEYIGSDKNTKENIDHTYLKMGNRYYRYTIGYRKELSTPKIFMKCIPCVVLDNKPIYAKPYKISVIIFKSGSVELIFSFCNDEPDICDETEFTIPIELKDQFAEIENELLDLKDFLVDILQPLGEQIVPNEEDLVNLGTVSGIHPYKKPLKYPHGTDVDIFDENTMDFEEIGKVISQNGNTYVTQLQDGTQVGIGPQFIRPSTQTGQKVVPMQLARSTISGTSIENRPHPYSFTGQCQGGKQYLVPFGGEQARDNLFYPKCEKATSTTKNIYLSHILEGFPQTQEEEDTYLIDRNSDYDFYSGIFQPGVTNINSKVLVKIPNGAEVSDGTWDYYYENMDDNGYVEGTIVGKTKTSQKGLDNYVIFIVDIGYDQTSGDRFIAKIPGSYFHPKYRQNRIWRGISGTPREQKEKIIRCTEKLGLSQSPFTAERLGKELQSKVLQDLEKYYPPKDPNRNTSALTQQTFRKFTAVPYISLAFPQNSQRVLFFVNNNRDDKDALGYYFVDDTNRIMKIPLNEDNILYSCVLDGYLYKNKQDTFYYYPIDCLWYRNKKLSLPYIHNFDPTEARESHSARNLRDTYEDLQELGIVPDNTLNTIIRNMDYGRFMYICYLSSVFNNPKFIAQKEPYRKYHFMYPIDYCSPKINIYTPWSSLSRNNIIFDTKQQLETTNQFLVPKELIFIPLNKKMHFLAWKRILNVPIVLGLTKKTMVQKNGKTKVPKYIFGIANKPIEPIGETPISLPAKFANYLMAKPPAERYLRFILNFMSNGQLNPEEPILLDSTNPYASSNDAWSHRRTELVVKAIADPILPTTFTQSDDSWTIRYPTKLVLVPQDIDPGTSPLVTESP